MSNVIELLERLGQDSQLRHASPEHLDRWLSDAGIEPTQRAAILLGDHRGLEPLLKAQPNVCCLIYYPEDESEETDTTLPGVARDAA